MRGFILFKRGEEHTRLDIYCVGLGKEEGEELRGILKNMGFTFCYMESDSILASLIGKYLYVKNIMKRLKKHYGFSWPEDPLIIGVPDDDIKEFGFPLGSGGKDSGSRLKVERKQKTNGYPIL